MSDCAGAAFIPGEKGNWVIVLCNSLWYPSVLTDVRETITLQ